MLVFSGVVKLDHFPKNWGEHKTYLKPPPPPSSLEFHDFPLHPIFVRMPFPAGDFPIIRWGRAQNEATKIVMKQKKTT